MSSRSQGKSSAPPSSSLPMNYEAANSRLLNRRTPMPPIESDTPNHKPAMLPPGANLSGGEYEAGRVVCEVCGRGVLFRDDSGAFTLKHWEAHRMTCSPHRPVHYPPQHPNTYNPLAYTAPNAAPSPSSSSQLSPTSPYNPPIKRRRAKRTEEERIDYLRSDPQVAEFEPYRVLCAGCNKWIRLRPNSTYCSIPWDAHRKICLEKRM